jgi:transposase
MSGMDEEFAALNIDQSVLTTGRKSARGARVEVITRGERRRSWTAEQKCQIVAESLGPELTPTEVARKYAIGSGQLYTWRRQLLSVQPGAVMTRAAPRFAQVELVSPPLQPGPEVPADQQPPDSSPPPSQSRPSGRMEIILPGGVTLRVDSDVDSVALRRVLAVLDRR